MVETLENLNNMPWQRFADDLAAAWGQAGYTVERLDGNDASKGNGAADMRLHRGGHSTLISAKRWKAASHGVEPLRALHAAMQADQAQSGIYVIGQGQPSDKAISYAREHAIALLQGDALARLLLNRSPKGNAEQISIQ